MIHDLNHFFRDPKLLSKPELLRTGFNPEANLNLAVTQGKPLEIGSDFDK